MPMEKRYKHLTLAERDRMMEMLFEGRKQSEIARELGRDKGTISRELKRNASPEYKKYLSHRAHERADKRRIKASRRERLKDEDLRRYVKEKLILGWSPELIAGRIKTELVGIAISHEAIYQYIYDSKTPGREELIKCLIRAHRKRKKKGIGRKQKRTKIPDRISIEERPASVETRQEIGHWEGDSVVSRKSKEALNSLAERKSRLVFITKLPRKGAKETRDAVIGRLKVLPEHARKTLTLDNGTENTRHKEITEAIGTRCYFAHPYASWERGTNENINGLIRWYLPKGTDFSKITEEQVARIEWLINNRPRKCLGFKTPYEIASSHGVALRS